MAVSFAGHDYKQGVPEQLEGLVAPHVESFDYFVERGLSDAVHLISPVEVHDASRKLRFFLWLENPVISKPFSEDSLHRPLLPAECRQAGSTYRGDFRIDLCVSYFDEDDDVADADVARGPMQRLPVNMGRMPIMVKSSLCHLRNNTQQQLIRRHEESLELGGYFICNGIERLLRLLIAPRRNYVMAILRPTLTKKGTNFSDKATTIRCVRLDQSAVSNRVVYVNDGTANLNFSLKKNEYFIPLAIILKALVEVSDAEMYALLTSILPAQSLGSSSGSSTAADGGHTGRAAVLGTQFVRDRALLLQAQPRALHLFTRAHCLAYLGKHFRAVLEVPAHKSDAYVGQQVLNDYVLVHLDSPRDKFRLLVYMVQKLWSFVDGTAQEDNPDTLMHHELHLPGHILTIFVKERLEMFLRRLQRQAQKEVGERPAQTDLRAAGWVRRVVDGGMNQLARDVEYLINTGNLSSPSGLDLTQRSGFTIVADKLNFHRYISHFRSVHRGAFFATLRTTAVRKLLPESWGFLCPVHTPDGAPCGLLTHLASCCLVTSDLLPSLSPSAPHSSLSTSGAVKSRDSIARAVLRALAPFGICPVSLGVPPAAPPQTLTVILDGLILGHLHADMALPAVTRLRCLKVDGELGIPQDLEIAHIPFSPMGTFPGLFLFSSPARFVRPVRQLPQLNPKAARGPPPCELIGSLEQVFLDIHCPDASAPDSSSSSSSSSGSKGAGHEEVGVGSILSVMANLTPWSDYNQSPRNMYQCQMGKQTMGVPLHSFPYRNDNKLYRLQSPQTPIARTAAYDRYSMDNFPTGTNAVVAVLAYTGYDMEDAMIINKSSMERGFAHGSIYKTEQVDASPQGGSTAGGAAGLTPGGLPLQMFSGPPGGRGRAGDSIVDADGLPMVGEHVKPDAVYASSMNLVTMRRSDVKLKGSEHALVDSVAVIAAPGSRAIQKAAVRLRVGRLPQIGDKFSSRHGQKGVLSQLWPDVDMPFATASGMRPDVIINPHAFPSRMTIGMLIESLASKSGALDGRFVNATPFRSSLPSPAPLTLSLKPQPPKSRHSGSSSTADARGKQRGKTTEAGGAAAAAAATTAERKTKVGERTAEAAGGTGGEGDDVLAVFGQQLVAKGFNYYGTETMYSGVYGTEMECDIYMGVVYYQRLRHMVSDKFQVRSTGPVHPLTQQPVKGRKRGGGIRFGEMERDAMLSHGAAFLLHDRLHACSDYHTADVCSLCGSLLAPSLPPTTPAAAGAILLFGGGVGAAALGYGTVGGEQQQRKVECRVCGTARGIVRVALPYVFRYLAAELAAMNIKLTLLVR